MMNPSTSRLARLRMEMKRLGLDGVLVPRADEHLGEFVPDAAERLAWLSGFAGSAGLGIVLRDCAALFVDGRYTEQARQQTDPAQWSVQNLTQAEIAAWLKRGLPDGRVGFDPWLHSQQFVKDMGQNGINLVSLSDNPVDSTWTDRPSPPYGRIHAHSLARAGTASDVKRTQAAAALRDAGAQAAILSDPASVCWLLNLRGEDVPFNPFVLAFAILHDTGAVDLFADPGRLDAELKAVLSEGVSIHPPGPRNAALAGRLAGLSGRRVLMDATASPAWFSQTLAQSGAVLIDGRDPCQLLKACKNHVEQDGARIAHRRDAVAIVRFLHWLDTDGRATDQTERSAAAELLRRRAEAPEFRGESFPAISAAGPHGALPHYRAGPGTDAPIAGGVYLIDSGGQYAEGTTDITRTIWLGEHAPPASLRDHYTRVLRGHIALARLVFPQGRDGRHLDAIARQFLWAAGLDYDHGTGHGVGSYLSVHEGPVSISRAAKTIPLAAGMILSDEPGLYLPGEYGIRLENLLLVRPHPAASSFLEFETLSLAPFDRALIDESTMTNEDVGWLDVYHARVLAEIGPLLDPATRNWLIPACAPMRDAMTPGG